MKNLQDFYDSTENIEDLKLFSLFVDCEPIIIKEVEQDKKWINAMDEEI